MSLVHNKTGQLWNSFGPYIEDIKNKINGDKISMQLYESSYHKRFNRNSEFEKWASVEVSDFKNTTKELE